MLSEMFSSSELAPPAAATAGFLDSQIITWNQRWQQRMQTSDHHEIQEKQPQIDADFVNNLDHHHEYSNYNQQWHNFVADETNSHFRGFHAEESAVHQYNWMPGSRTSSVANCEEEDHQNYDHCNQAGNTYHGQGLSLSLSNSSSLRPLGTNLIKFEDVRMGNHHHHHHHDGQFLVGFGSSLEKMNLMRNSKYGKAAKELLEEIVSNTSLGMMKNQSTVNPNFGKKADPSTDRTAMGSYCSTSSFSKGNVSNTSLSAADRSDYQRRKAKLISMLHEVDERYRTYRDKMRLMVNSFDTIMGYGSAKTYTTMAQKAMSRHFRSVRNAVTEQLKSTCDILGEKETGSSYGLTKAETPRLKALDQSLRQQRAFQQTGMLGELEGWRPQRGLPENSLSILRAWLFDHFLNPYPSDADKHLLSRQTGLSKNQVSNWFINARVRLWKPMVEEMYQRDAKEEEDGGGDGEQASADQDQNYASTFKHSSLEGHDSISRQKPMLLRPIQRAQHVMTSPHPADAFFISDGNKFFDSTPQVYPWLSDQSSVSPSKFVFGRINGDVSLTLGLRHAGNSQEGQVPARKFRTC